MQQEIEQLSTAELKAIAAKIPAEIEKRRFQELVQLREELEAVCAAKGYKLQDVAAITFKQKKAVAAKYRHPETGETWTGRGRSPVWVAQWRNLGRDIEELAI